jgi:hypothetical protein
MKKYLKNLGDKIFLKYTRITDWLDGTFEVNNGVGLALMFAFILVLIKLYTLSCVEGCY